ncbi:HNH endonuclease [Streptomyces sp. NPDC004227]
MSNPIARISRPQAWRHEFIREHGYRCHYCNRFAGSVEVGPDGKPWHVDHMNALAAGGEDVEENLTLACGRCNSLKHTLPYDNFRRYARQLLWSGEPQRLRLEDLEALEGAFLRTSSGRWLTRDISDERSEYTSQLFALEDHESDLDAANVIGEFLIPSGRTGGGHNLRFVIEAHRLVPQLIAEIHLLHAELAMLRGQQDTPAA